MSPILLQDMGASDYSNTSVQAVAQSDGGRAGVAHQALRRYGRYGAGGHQYVLRCGGRQAKGARAVLFLQGTCS